jgi:hypothetical protein
MYSPLYTILLPLQINLRGSYITISYLNIFFSKIFWFGNYIITLSNFIQTKYFIYLQFALLFVLSEFNAAWSLGKLEHFLLKFTDIATWGVAVYRCMVVRVNTGRCHYEGLVWRHVDLSCLHTPTRLNFNFYLSVFEDNKNNAVLKGRTSYTKLNTFNISPYYYSSSSSITAPPLPSVVSVSYASMDVSFSVLSFSF